MVTEHANEAVSCSEVDFTGTFLLACPWYDAPLLETYIGKLDWNQTISKSQPCAQFLGTHFILPGQYLVTNIIDVVSQLNLIFCSVIFRIFHH